jgi:hypothetical protein
MIHERWTLYQYCFLFIIILSIYYLCTLELAPFKPCPKYHNGPMYYQMNRRCKYS